MYKGYYNAVSGMLTQQRVLNTISNNITNASTPGFKRDITVSSTFREMMAYRMGNVDKSNPTALGELSSIRTVQELVTLYGQGAVNSTGRAFDFAIAGDGFFEIQTGDGVAYTRNGAFTLDEQGYLCMQAGGRVMGQNGGIYLGTDQFKVTPDGTITLNTGAVAGRIRLVDFADYETLSKNAAGFFVSTAGPVAVDPAETSLMWGALEGSNVDVMEETVSMIEAQRAFQSTSQLFRLYDQLSDSANEIARI